MTPRAPARAGASGRASSRRLRARAWACSSRRVGWWTGSASAVVVVAGLGRLLVRGAAAAVVGAAGLGGGVVATAVVGAGGAAGVWGGSWVVPSGLMMKS